MEFMFLRQRCRTSLRVMAAVLAFSIMPQLVLAQSNDRWISDQFEVTLRTGKSTQKSIIRVLASGSKVEMLEQDDGSGYTRVRTAGGTEGWLLTRYLVSAPIARLRLPELESRLRSSEASRNELSQQIRELQQERNALQNQVAKQAASSKSLQEQLDRIRKLSSETVQLDDQNKRLNQRLIDSVLRIDQLETENRELLAKSTREWFIVGAAVLTFGVLLGLLIPRLRLRKKSGWGEF